LFHAKRGSRVKRGEPLATLYSTKEAMLGEPVNLVKRAIRFSDTAPAAVALVDRIFTKESAEAFLADMAPA
jgi:thymidine phosphorylase